MTTKTIKNFEDTLFDDEIELLKSQFPEVVNDDDPYTSADPVKLYSLYLHKLLTIFDDPFLRQKYALYSNEKIPKLDQGFYKRMDIDFKKKEKECRRYLQKMSKFQDEILRKGQNGSPAVCNLH